MRTIVLFIGLVGACGSPPDPAKCSPQKITNCIATATGGCIISSGRMPPTLAVLCSGGDEYPGCSPSDSQACYADCTLAANCKNP